MSLVVGNGSSEIAGGRRASETAVDCNGFAIKAWVRARKKPQLRLLWHWL